MYSKRFFILQKINQVLSNIPNVQSIHSQIELPIDRSEVPAINIAWSSENIDSFGDDIRFTKHLNITISVICRGAEWQEESDLISIDIHKKLQTINDDDIYHIQKKSTSIEQHTADTTCGVLNNEYLISYYDY